MTLSTKHQFRDVSALWPLRVHYSYFFIAFTIFFSPFICRFSLFVKRHFLLHFFMWIRNLLRSSLLIPREFYCLTIAVYVSEIAERTVHTSIYLYTVFLNLSYFRFIYIFFYLSYFRIIIHYFEKKKKKLANNTITVDFNTSVFKKKN